MKIRTPYPALSTSVLTSLALLGALTILPPDESKPAPRPANVFARTEEAQGYNLSYGWKDFNGKSLHVSFPISKRDLSEAEEEFGYRQEELDRHLEAWGVAKNEGMILSLKNLLRDLINRSGYGDYILIEEKGSLEFTLKLSVPGDLQDKVKPVYEAIKARLADEYGSASKIIQDGILKERDRFIESRGLVADGDRFRVDYRRSVWNNTARVRHVLEALRRVGEKPNLRQFLGMALSFIQDIGYVVPPIQEGEKFILGFWPPPRVLAENSGDCDSKGVAFASLWLNFKKYPVLLVRIPDHMIIGLAIPSTESEGAVINGLRYTLCEVSPSGKIPPGLVSYYSSVYLKSGRYQYEIVTR